jgi:hypothetical protein
MGGGGLSSEIFDGKITGGWMEDNGFSAIKCLTGVAKLPPQSK